MNNRGKFRSTVLINLVPHPRYPGTGGINNFVTLLLKKFHLLQTGPKGRPKHDIIGLNLAEVFLTVMFDNKANAHPR